MTLTSIKNLESSLSITSSILLLKLKIGHSVLLIILLTIQWILLWSKLLLKITNMMKSSKGNKNSLIYSKTRIQYLKIKLNNFNKTKQQIKQILIIQGIGKLINNSCLYVIYWIWILIVSSFMYKYINQ